VRLKAPRIEPVREPDWTPAQRAVLEPLASRNQLYNIYTTLARNPDAFTAFVAWGGYVLRASTLPAREKELLILRVGWNCHSGYEWSQHARLGRAAGLTPEELTGIKRGPIWEHWSKQDKALLNAADELFETQFISDATWRALTEWYSDRHMMDIVFVVAHYMQVCMILNTFGVQLDENLRADPDLACA
jgi:4-carboxymuconolactone decarboxylase